MSEPYNRRVNLEEAAGKLLEEDESVIGSSESDLSDGDDSEYIPHVVERNMDENSDSDMEAFVESLRSAEKQGKSESDSDSEDSMTTTLNTAAIQAASSSHTSVPCSMPLSSTSQAFLLLLFQTTVLHYNHPTWTLALVKMELIGVQPHLLKEDLDLIT